MKDKKNNLEIPILTDIKLEDLRLLKHHEGNPNSMTIKQKEQLWHSLKKYGWVWPIVADKDGIISDGEQRIDVCISHGEFYGPVLRRPLTEAERLILGQELNKLRGKHNKKEDEAEYEKIKSLGAIDELNSLLEAVGEKMVGSLERMPGSLLIPETRELIVGCKDETLQNNLYYILISRKLTDEQRKQLDEILAKGLPVKVLNL